MCTKTIERAANHWNWDWRWRFGAAASPPDLRRLLCTIIASTRWRRFLVTAAQQANQYPRALCTWHRNWQNRIEFVRRKRMRWPFPNQVIRYACDGCLSCLCAWQKSIGLHGWWLSIYSLPLCVVDILTCISPFVRLFNRGSLTNRWIHRMNFKV